MTGSPSHIYNYYDWEVIMSNAVIERKLLPKGVYACPRCDKQAEVFVRVIEVACNQHGQMSRKGRK